MPANGTVGTVDARVRWSSDWGLLVLVAWIVWATMPGEATSGWITRPTDFMLGWASALTLASVIATFRPRVGGTS